MGRRSGQTIPNTLPQALVRMRLPQQDPHQPLGEDTSTGPARDRVRAPSTQPRAPFALAREPRVARPRRKLKQQECLHRVTLALETPHAAGLPLLISVSLPAAGRSVLGTSMSTNPPAYAASWLTQAELSTFFSAPRVLPRFIYFSHQFTSHTLGEDYRTLIWRYQFAIGGTKIDVRREVEVSAFAAGGEAFVEGFASSPRAIRRPHSHAHTRAPDAPQRLVRVVPQLNPHLGRLRREMRHQLQKQPARLPPAARRGGDDVEEDDFVPPSAETDVFLRVHVDREDNDALSATTSRNGEDLVASISTPATSAHPLEDEERERIDLDGDGDGAEGGGRASGLSSSTMYPW
ncbi:hypothetical protein B0H13DRAFT_2340902 [Mycena leptocephala]|nr:hypothetical protein B0H13DRAFT_2340902 [Mycena leptocephala]